MNATKAQIWNYLKKVCILSLVVFVFSAVFICYSLFKPNMRDLIGAVTHDDIVKIDQCLRAGVDVNGTGKWGWYGELDGKTPLNAAIQWANISTIAHLIHSGADVNLRDGFGTSPAVDAAIRGDLEIIQLLADSGTRFDVTHENKTPFEWAQISGKDEAADLIKKLTKVE